MYYLSNAYNWQSQALLANDNVQQWPQVHHPSVTKIPQIISRALVFTVLQNNVLD